MPVFYFQFFEICGGSASPAETHSRSHSASLPGNYRLASIAA